MLKLDSSKIIYYLFICKKGLFFILSVFFINNFQLTQINPMASEEQLQFYNEIINKGCCKRCALRYLGCCKTLITFDDPDTCLTNFGYIPYTVDLREEPNTKKRKINPCIVCLGLLHDSLLDKMLSHENLPKIEEYENDTFVSYITFPTCVLIRDRSMRIYLKQSFPNCFDDGTVIRVNHAWRYSIEEKLCQLLNKMYNHLSKLTLHFYTNYPLEEDEMAILQDFVRNQRPSDTMSKHYVTALLESICDEDFARSVTVPPKVPLYEVTLKDLKYFSESIHLIGNYCKYSRQLYQVPAYHNKELLMQYSIETIVSDAIRNVAGDCKEIIFKASSFDERTVRVLGKGRTFHVQIVDPKFQAVTKSHCQKIESKIKECQVMTVQNLREADRRDILVIMDSEILSPRSFKLLCLVHDCRNIDYCVNAVNMYTSLIVHQKTPMRLLLERPAIGKRKKILYIRARKVKRHDNLIELDICADAGLYIPEFVNSDLGRTKPSLKDIMRAKVECVAIDVVDFCVTTPCATDEEQAMRTITTPG